MVKNGEWICLSYIRITTLLILQYSILVYVVDPSCPYRLSHMVVQDEPWSAYKISVAYAFHWPYILHQSRLWACFGLTLILATTDIQSSLRAPTLHKHLGRHNDIRAMSNGTTSSSHSCRCRDVRQMPETYSGDDIMRRESRHCVFGLNERV